MIYKILRPHEWQQANGQSHFDGSPVDLADGFIHFSTGAQVKTTAARHFTDSDSVHVLAVSVAALPGALLKWEASRGGALFPHLYAPLPMTAVAAHWLVTRAASGDHDFSAIEDIARHA